MSGANPGHAASQRGKLAVVTWVAVYPTITVFLWLFERLGLLGLPLPLRTFVLTGILVPAMVFVLMPTLTTLFGRWLGAAEPSEPPEDRR